MCWLTERNNFFFFEKRILVIAFRGHLDSTGYFFHLKTLKLIIPIKTLPGFPPIYSHFHRFQGLECGHLLKDHFSGLPQPI